MLTILSEVKVLKTEGKLHTKLVSRLRMLFVISFILCAILLFNILFRGANFMIASVIILLGFVLGLFVFSKMNAVNWNEEKELIEAGKMNTVGYTTLALYIAFEIILRNFLNDAFPIYATAYVLSAIFGTILGRAIGTVFEIHKVFQKYHPVQK